MQAAIALRATLAAKGYQSAVLNISIPLEADTAATQAFQVVQMPNTLSLKELPQADRSVVLRLDEGDPDIGIGGLNAYQMKALEVALNKRTQAIIADSKEIAATATLKQRISEVWSTYLLPYEDYQAVLTNHKEEHEAALQPLVVHLTETLRDHLQDLIMDFSAVPMTLSMHIIQALGNHFATQLDYSVYPSDRLSFLAHDLTGLVIAQWSEARWTAEQRQQAQEAGWLIEDMRTEPRHSKPHCNQWSLQADSESDHFLTDEQAWLHVTTEAQSDPSGLCAQALTFLSTYAPQSHRQVWVYSFTRLVREALQTPQPMLTWLQSLEPQRAVSWRPVEAFLRSMGVQRSQVDGTYVWLYYWDEPAPITVLGLDSKGQTLEDAAAMPQWVFDFEQELATVADHKEEPPTAGDVCRLIQQAMTNEATTAVTGM